MSYRLNLLNEVICDELLILNKLINDKNDFSVD
jgi:hypothetical protein